MFKCIAIQVKDVTVGMRLRSFSKPETYYLINEITETETGRRFAITYNVDGKKDFSFFQNDEEVKILIDNADEKERKLAIKERVRCYQYQRLQTLMSRLQAEVKPDSDLFTMNSHWLMIQNFVETTSSTARYIEEGGEI